MATRTTDYFKIKKEFLVSVIIIAVCIVTLVLGMYDSGTRIDRYIPRNVDEAAIIRRIIVFHNAASNHDLESYLSCLSSEGKFMFSGTLMVSKSELARLLPGFWADLESGNMLVRAMCRESLNGNFFNGFLYDPVIEIAKNRATAIVKFVTPITRWKTYLFLKFEKYNNRWEIHEVEWDMG